MNEYNDGRWKKKRKEILRRDNYTCQNCKTFNPALDIVHIINPQTDDFELHQYENFSGIYNLTSKDKNITIQISFGPNTWLVMPVLQVHHKRYISGKQIWDYDDDDLVTLCKQCHTDYHLNNPIDYFDENEIKVDTKEIEVKDFDPDHSHGYPPWIFITRDGKKYSSKDLIKPIVRYLLIGDQINYRQKIEEEIIYMVEDFFKKYLPSYKHEIEFD